MFSTSKQSIPQCFQDKIVLDRLWRKVQEQPIVVFVDARKVKHQRDTARMRCIENVAKKIGTDGRVG